MSGGGKMVHVLSGQPYDAYVGRAMLRRGLEGHALANPFRIGKDGHRGTVLRRYEETLRDAIEHRPDEVLPDLGHLRGRTLAC